MGQATIETVYITFISMFFTIVLGFLLGLLLYSLGKKHSPFGKILFFVVSIASNIFRSIPYIVLLVLLIPFTKFMVGTMIGPVSVIPSLIVSAIPFYARLVEVALREVNSGVLEAADAMGASPFEKTVKVLLSESLPALLSGITITTVSMIGYTAMGGVVGGGGLGQLAYQQGFTLGKLTVTLVATAILLLLVFAVQFIGDMLVKRADKR
ncbi:methionine ABC transporter permease [Pilibacter termitis]|nr:methionine ABC transporter permease [Pilibacter termitis]